MDLTFVRRIILVVYSTSCIVPLLTSCSATGFWKANTRRLLVFATASWAHMNYTLLTTPCVSATNGSAGSLGSIPLQLRTSRLANARLLSPSRTNGPDTLLVPPRDLRSCRKAKWTALRIGRRSSTSQVITVVCAWRAYRYVSSSFHLRHPFIELPSRLRPLLV